MQTLTKYFLLVRPSSFLIALSMLLIANAVVIREHSINIEILIFTAIISLLLQALCNLANDLGDHTRGTDQSERRIGPSQMLQRGETSISEMYRAIYSVTLLCILFGLFLLYRIYQTKSLISLFIFLTIGILAIISAITYTLGKKPYGYNGLGDLFVFIFFGPISVISIFYLQTDLITFEPILPSIVSGLLITSVLNVNNIRDIDNDKLSNKITIATQLGHHWARYYHLWINGVAIIAFLLYIHQYTSFSILYLNYIFILIPLLIIVYGVFSKPSSQLQPYLIATIILNVVFALLFFIIQFIMKY